VANHFGQAIALPYGVLKITTEVTPKNIALRLEGAIAGPWVAEFRRAWHSVAQLLTFNELSLDFREVTRIDAKGRELLAEILSETNADVQTSSLLIESYVREARQQNQQNRNGVK
jgi:hypothetical protein